MQTGNQFTLERTNEDCAVTIHFRTDFADAALSAVAALDVESPTPLRTCHPTFPQGKRTQLVLRPILYFTITSIFWRYLAYHSNH